MNCRIDDESHESHDFQWLIITTKVIECVKLTLTRIHKRHHISVDLTFLLHSCCSQAISWWPKCKQYCGVHVEYNVYGVILRK